MRSSFVSVFFKDVTRWSDGVGCVDIHRCFVSYIFFKALGDGTIHPATQAEAGVADIKLGFKCLSLVICSDQLRSNRCFHFGRIVFLWNQPPSAISLKCWPKTFQNILLLKLNSLNTLSILTLWRHWCLKENNTFWSFYTTSRWAIRYSTTFLLSKNLLISNRSHVFFISFLAFLCFKANFSKRYTLIVDSVVLFVLSYRKT